MVNTKNNNVVGVVLAGGLSSRLGADKAQLVMHAPHKKNGEREENEERGEVGEQKENSEQKTLLDHSVKLLQSMFERVCVVGREHKECEWILDTIPHLGPVGAIATALQHIQAPCFVLPCDVPQMQASTLKALLSFHQNNPSKALMTAYRNQSTRYVETLVAIYEPQATPYFIERVAQRLLKIALIVPMPLQRYLDYAENIAPDFFNINYPTDLAILKALRKPT